MGNTDVDGLYDYSVSFVVESHRASISMIQRKLCIDYNQAKQIIERMKTEVIIYLDTGKLKYNANN